MLTTGASVAAFLTDTLIVGSIIYISKKLWIFIRANQIPEKNYRYLAALSSLLLIYSAWFYAWDTSWAFFPHIIEHWFHYPIDIINIVYPIICYRTLIFYRDSIRSINDAAQIIPSERQLLAMDDLSLLYHLTEREKDLLALVIQGMSNPDIADRLCISNNTVKRHMNNIFKKTGSKNRYALIQMIK